MANILIGGGIGAISAALRLSLSNHTSIIFEKKTNLGGKLNYIKNRSTYFDLGPTLLTMPFILEDLFHKSRHDMSSYLTLFPVEPTCRYHWSDGIVFNAYSHNDAFDEEVHRLFPRDLTAVRKFRRDIASFYHQTKGIFLFEEFKYVQLLLNINNISILSGLQRIGICSTMSLSLSKRFQSTKLIQFFERFATYTGSSPYKASSTLNVIPFIELEYGAWYPKGGMYSIIDALGNLAKKVGVTIYTDSAIDRIERKNRRITTVHANEIPYASDNVICNVDALWTYRNLLNPIGIKTPSNVENSERSSSGFLILAIVRGTHSQLAHHNIFFSDDYRSEFKDVFEKKRLPQNMTIYVSISSKTDPSLAPEGHENWYVLVNAPSNGVEHRDPDANERYVQAIWERLKEFGLSPEIVWQSQITPVDIETAYNAIDGAIYGASSNSILSPFTRPKNKVPHLDNFYFASGSVHPGGGIPLAILSGKIAADIIQRKHDQ